MYLSGTYIWYKLMNEVIIELIFVYCNIFQRADEDFDDFDQSQSVSN